MKILDFCLKHRACDAALAYIKKHGVDASCEEAWQTCPRYDWLVWLATWSGVLTELELRRFVLFAARGVAHLTKDEKMTLKNLQIVEDFFINKTAEEEAYMQARRALFAADAAATAADAAAADAAADAATYASAYAAADAATYVYPDMAPKLMHYLRTETKPTFPQ
jgi:hypothetical protein